MNRLTQIAANKKARKFRIRSSVSGTSKRPRLSVFISHKHISAQLIDDTNQKTLAYATTVGQKKLPQNLTERASWVGEEIATKAKTAKIKKVAMDRNGKLYHGRLKAVAQAARKSGLEF